mgnify:CR=1 FL=1
MALKIYKEATTTSAFSIEGVYDNPFSLSFNGVTGGVIETKCYLRNNSLTRWYSDISIQPIDGGEDIVDGNGTTEGFNWRLIEGDSQPTEEEWMSIVSGTAITLSDIGSATTGDITSFLPFWIRVEVPEGATVACYQDVTLKISYSEGIVT